MPLTKNSHNRNHSNGHTMEVSKVWNSAFMLFFKRFFSIFNYFYEAETTNVSVRSDFSPLSILRFSSKNGNVDRDRKSVCRGFRVMYGNVDSDDRKSLTDFRSLYRFLFLRKTKMWTETKKFEDMETFRVSASKKKVYLHIDFFITQDKMKRTSKHLKK